MSEEKKKNHERRLNALKNNQLRILDIESNYYEELQKLNKKFACSYEPLFDERERIVSGEHEPTDEESVWPYSEPHQHEDNEPSSMFRFSTS